MSVTESRLLLNVRDAARSLSICQKTLWAHTRPRGSIPCVRIGSRVLYNPRDLEAWIEAWKKGGEPK